MVVGSHSLAYRQTSTAVLNAELTAAWHDLSSPEGSRLLTKGAFSL